MKAHFLLQLLLTAWLTCVSVAFADTPVLPETMRSPDKLVLLEFYSDYCGTCRMMNPHVEALKARHSGKIDFKRIDIGHEGNDALIERYHIDGTPTYLLFNAQGAPIFEMRKIISPKVLKTQLDRYGGVLQPTAGLQKLSGIKKTLSAKPYTLVAVEPKACASCGQTAPYLGSMELLRGEQMSVLKLPADKPVTKATGAQKLPAYILYDAQARELYRMEGEIAPKILWQYVQMFTQTP